MFATNHTLNYIMPHRLLNTDFNWFIKLILLGFAWFAPAATAVLGIIALIFIDTILGIQASKKRGIPFSSRRLSEVLTKCITYFLGIFATHLMQDIFIDDLGFNIFKFTVFIFAAIELLSIYENISIIIGKDIVKLLANLFRRSGKIKSALKDIIIETAQDVSNNDKKEQ